MVTADKPAPSPRVSSHTMASQKLKDQSPLLCPIIVKKIPLVRQPPRRSEISLHVVLTIHSRKNLSLLEVPPTNSTTCCDRPTILIPKVATLHKCKQELVATSYLQTLYLSFYSILCARNCNECTLRPRNAKRTIQQMNKKILRFTSPPCFGYRHLP